MPQFAAQRRSIFTNFPIPFDHPYTVPALIAALSTSSLIYYYLSASHDAELREAQRRRDLQKRKSLKRPEDRFASMKVSSTNPLGVPENKKPVVVDRSPLFSTPAKITTAF
jgi:N-acyl-phosphatidylethanolamine-hydrolysing phospholipase D